VKYAHKIIITEFATKNENIETIKESLKTLLPFDLEKEKISIHQQTTTGFNEQPITILAITLTKEKHTNDFIKFLTKKLTEEQKKLLLAQKESRTDKNNCFYIRIEKDQWNNQKKILITDSGNCIHVKITLAAYPSKLEIALKLVDKIFETKNI